MSTDVMLDLETLSSQPDAAIISIGACTFRTDGAVTPAADRKLFYTTVDMASAQRTGGHIDARTVLWWLQQSDAARTAAVGNNPPDITAALATFRSWLTALAFEHNGVLVWGNGAGFDNVVLRRAYERLQLDTPWAFYQDRCYRTLKNLRPDVALARMGTAHSALDDAVSQAIHAEQILAAMRAPSAAEAVSYG